jgi:hypothetical protein
MFIGHFALAFAAKRAEPRGSLLAYLLAAQLPDLLWPVFLLLGWERVAIEPGFTAVTPLRFVAYPISHSLLTVALWALAFALAYGWRGGRRSAATLCGLLVVSHWVLDAASHAPDMPLAPWGGPRVGLSLWDSVPATLLVEGALYAAGVALYARATRPRDPSGRWGLALVAGVLLAVYIGNVFGPPPPSVNAIALSMPPATLLIAWAMLWLERHRETQ